MRVLRNLLLLVLLLVVVGVLGLYATGNQFFLRAVQRTYLTGHNTANINDHEVFNVHTVAAGVDAQPLAKSTRYNEIALDSAFAEYLNGNRTAAFLVLQRGEILSEHYFGAYHDRSRTNSFSMAKTILTLLVGIAIDDGYIKSFDQPLVDFLPEFANDPLGKKATLANLSLMNSGYEWTEHYYSPFSPTVQLYHGPDVEDFLVSRHFSAEPGTFWEYSSASTQLLAIALKRALANGGRPVTLAEYLSEKVWQPLGMNDDALWHTDDSGMELAYCCINSNARNFAKLGQLMLNRGRWGDRQIVSADFVDTMITPDGAPWYGYSTWLGLDESPAYYAFQGHLGQYVVVIPERELVIVRLGETRPASEDENTIKVGRYVAEALRMISLQANERN